MTLNPMEGLVHALSGTVIVYNEGWADSVPSWMMDHVKMERMILNMERLKGRALEECTDIEAAIYLYTMSLTVGMNEMAANVYTYLVGKYVQLPTGHTHPELSKEEQNLLNELKRNIYRDSVKEFSKKLRREM